MVLNQQSHCDEVEIVQVVLSFFRTIQLQQRWRNSTRQSEALVEGRLSADPMHWRKRFLGDEACASHKLRMMLENASNKDTNGNENVTKQ